LVVDTSNGGVNTSRFIMVGASSFTGDITVNANSELQTNSIFTGDIASFGVGSSGFGPAITMNSGSVITIYGPGQTPSVLVASLNGPADSTLRAESGTNIFKIGGDGSDSNFAGTFINAGGAGGITKVGAGTLTLSGASSFTAAVNINGGIVSVPTVADTGNNSPLGAGTAATGFNGGTLRYTGTTGSTNRNATLNAGGGTVQVDQAAETLTLAGDITGTGALTKTGPGTLSLTGAANTYSGLTTVGNGTLQIANWNGATAFALNDQTTLLYTGAGGSQAASKGLALPGTAGQSATINVQDPAAILNFASAGSNTVTGDGDLVKEGPGTLQLAQASVSQNWNGKTTINAGSVDYFGGGSMLRTVAAADAFTINDGATFKLTYTGGSSTIGTNNGFVIGSAIDDNATFEIYTGATFVHQFNNVISGPGNFIKTGTGNMGLANVNTFTGTVTLDDGAISLGTWNQAGTNGSWGNRPNTTAGTDFIQMAGATINYTGGNAGGNLRGVNLVSGNNVINITNAGATLNFQGGGWNTFQGNGGNLIKEGPGTLQIGAAGVANNVFNGSKVVINAGTLEWWGAGSMPSPGGFGASDAITINNGGTFRLSYGDVPTVVNSAIGFRLSGDATVSSNAPTADHTIAGVVADKVASTGNLIKAGAGILGLSNINTYTGNTIINAGTLRLTTAGTNNIASSPLIHLTGVGTNLNVTGVTGGFTLASGQMLQGIGTVTGNSTVGAGSFLSPGNSPGTTPFVGNHTWAGLGTLVWEINDATGNFGVEMDLITVSALLDITATTGSKFNIDIVGLDAGNAVGVVPGFNNLFDYAWLIADAGSTVSSFDADKFNLLTSNFTANNPLGGGTFGIVRGDAPGIGGDDTQLFLTFTPVPEPSSLALLALGLISLNLFRRRQ
jgi:autotransporter-associated beta strand protein